LIRDAPLCSLILIRSERERCGFESKENMRRISPIRIYRSAPFHSWSAPAFPMREREANFSSEMMELLCEGLCCALFGLKSKCVAGAVCALFSDPQTLDVAELIISRRGFSKQIYRFSPLRFHSIDFRGIFFIKATSRFC
jgi:hypothetical protein